MGSKKKDLVAQEETVQADDRPPPYEEASAAGPSRYAESTSTGGAPPPPPPPPLEQSGAQSAGPTVASPFDFPSQEAPPPYPSQKPIQKPIAIPQTRPEAAAPLLQAYAPSLLSRGIPAERWFSFLDTLSAFLAATVSERAIAHAADVSERAIAHAASVSERAIAHAKSVGHGIADSARKGRVLGAAAGLVAAAVTIPVNAALGAAGAAVRFPGSALAATSRRPLAPRERADAYVAVAGRDWLGPRRLEARLLDTRQLGELLGVPASRLVGAARGAERGTAAGRLGALATYISELEVLVSSEALEIGDSTLWLVVTDKDGGL
ncbi:hypothetical protein DL766_008876 [Monosporascus sp. MC13-8B]|uniref:Uncharacterized protein n=1 Tax=Monosporascus cannonballus TaxID=155416 RepID=A0ABY0GYV2_9PEZI|nr:hypothetical protein DL762_008904 [Monosporascus cannonballus]RYO92467.1 hypothetical protein DL763_004694 [Monosporascus cannonballus]RYP17601.1 hypothetical protein DL766_008876 [Monosporascus sp. MC13-8B]